MAPIIRSLVVAPNAVTVAAGTEPDVARTVAARLLEAGFQPSELDKAVAAKAPLLLVGTTKDIADALARTGLPARPQQLGERGTARAWTARYGDDVPMLVVEGADADALRQVAAALRHYGADSYLVFEGSRVVDRGVWPPTARPLEVEFKN